MTYQLFKWYFRLRLIGIVVHELAHAVTVKLCRGTIVELDLTSHVIHRGQYSLLQQIAIDYAPMVINSTAAVGLATSAMWVPDSPVSAAIMTQFGGSVLGLTLVMLLQSIILLVGFFFAAAAFPSYQDAKNPYERFRHQLTNLCVRRLLTIPLALPLLLIFLLPLGFTYLRSKSPNLRVTTELSFATLLILQATGTVIVVDPVSLWDTAVRTVDWLADIVVRNSGL